MLRYLGSVAILFSISFGSARAADWNPRAAADYLDQRQKDWFAWKPAMNPGGVCVSCHTQVTYLFARPALRSMLGESAPTAHETGLLDVMRARVSKTQVKDVSNGFKSEPGASQALGVEAILSALFLGRESGPNRPLTSDAKQAFDRLWSFSIREGDQAGSWAWFSLKLDPWEMPDSKFYGASLAAISVASLPADYRKQPEIARNIDALTAYLQRAQAAQPLHNRLMALWASSATAGILNAAAKKKLIDEVWAKQESDGGWTIQSLGPWQEHPDAPPSVGSNAYATALTANANLDGRIEVLYLGTDGAIYDLRQTVPNSSSWSAIERRQ